MNYSYMIEFGFKEARVIMPTNTEGLTNIARRITESPTGRILHNPAMPSRQKIEHLMRMDDVSKRQLGRDMTRMSNIGSMMQEKMHFEGIAHDMPATQHTPNNPRYMNAWRDMQDNMKSALLTNDAAAKGVVPEYGVAAANNTNISRLNKLYRGL